MINPHSDITAQLGREITGRIDLLATLSDEPGRLTRLYLSPAHRRTVDQVSQWMRDAGMAVQLDAIGNVGQLDSAVADRTAAKAVQEVGLSPAFGADNQGITLQQTGVAIAVGDDFGIWRDP